MTENQAPNDPPLAAPTGSLKYSDDIPMKEGGYFMTCAENEYIPEWVSVSQKGAYLIATLDSLGSYPIKMLHDGLTDVRWAHAISVNS